MNNIWTTEKTQMKAERVINILITKCNLQLLLITTAITDCLQFKEYFKENP